jgi:hypothetical protein
MQSLPLNRRAAAFAAAIAFALICAFAFTCSAPPSAQAHGGIEHGAGASEDPESAIDPNAIGSTRRHAIADGLQIQLKNERRNWTRGQRQRLKKQLRLRAKLRRAGKTLLTDQQIRERVLLQSLGTPLAPADVGASLAAPEISLLSASANPSTSDALCQSANAAQIGAWSCPVTPNYPTTGSFTRNGITYAGDPIINTANPYEFDTYHNIAANSTSNNRYWSPNPRIVPVFEAMLPNGKIIFWDWYFTGVMDDPNQESKAGTRILIWDPAHPELPGVRKDYYGANLFCAGYSQLPNGDLLLAGGNANAAMAGIKQTFVYHWRTGVWERSQDMARPRWYPAVSALSDGQSLILGGDPTDNDSGSPYYTPGTPYPEVFSSSYLPGAAQAWNPASPSPHLRSLTNLTGQIPAWRLYPQNFPSVDGRVIFAGSQPGMQLIDPRGTGSVTNYGNRDSVDRVYGAGTYYANGRVLVSGGGQPAQYTFSVPQANRGPGWNNPANGWVCMGYFWGDPATGVQQVYSKSDCIGNNTMTFANDHGATASATKIDLTHDSGPDANQGIPTAAATDPMNFPRRMHQMTVLPDGTVTATGGMTTTDPHANQALDATNDNSNHTLVNLDAPANAAELWNPQTGHWTVGASASVPRMYHSTAILLPDGRVLQGGGGVCGACVHYAYSEGNFQYYSPPYLFNSNGSARTTTQRPRITGPFVTDGDNTQMLAPVDYNSTLNVNYAQADGGVPLAKATMIKLGAPTHGIDQGQRYIPVGLQVNSATSATVTAPDNAYEAPPGFYMLFLLDQNGTPSVAKIVQVGARLALANVPSAVSVYAGTNKSGASQDLGLGKFSSKDGNFAQVGDNNIASLVIQPGYHADVCTGNDFTSCTSLAAGTYNTLSAALTDTVSSITVFDGNISTPPAPVITSPSGSPAYSKNLTNAISGTAEASSTVKLYDGATLAGQTTASAGGAWSINATLTAGDHSLTAIATNVNGTGPTSSALALKVDVTQPAISITQPAAAGWVTTAAASVLFSVTDANPGTTTCQVDSGSTGACSSPFTTPALTEGQHSVTISSTDLAGNAASAAVTFTTDSTKPAVSISQPAASALLSTATPAIQFSSTDTNLASTKCKIDAGAANNCSSPFTTPTLTDGQHTVTVTGTDAAGNVQNASVTFTVDTTKPSVSISQPLAAAFLSDSTPSIQFTATDVNPGSTTCKVDGGSANACSSPFTTGTLSDGQHTVTVASADAVGNSASAAVTFTVDTGQPAVSISQPAALAYLSDATPTIQFSATDVNLSTTKCKVDNGVANNCTSPFTTPTLSEGQHTVTISGTDFANNSASAAVTFTVDTTKPSVSISQPAAAAFLTDTTPSIQFSATDANPGTTTCKLDAASASACTSPFTTSTLSEGQHTVVVSSTDLASNNQTASVTFTIDSTQPSVSISQPAPLAFLADATPSIQFSATDANLATTKCKVDSGVASDCASPFTPPALSEGQHTVTVLVTDLANHSASAAVTITVDTIKPNVAISQPAAAAFLADPTPSIQFSATDANTGTTTCKLDAGSASACTSPFTTGTLGEGQHTVVVSSTDLASNNQTASVTFTIDSTQPSVAISQPLPAALLATATPTIQFSATDANPGATKCKIDTGAANACSSPFTTPSLADGQHTVTVSSTDLANNSASAAVTFTIDATKPAPPQITAPATPTFTGSTSVTVSGTAEAASTVTLFDGATAIGSMTATGGAFSFATTLAANAQHTLTAKAADAAANVSNASTAVVVTVDTIQPQISITALPAPVLVAKPTVSFSVTDTNLAGSSSCKIDSGSAESCSSPWTTASALSEGVHSVTISRGDLAGNVGTATTSFTVDLPPAAPQITSPIGSPAFTNDATPTISGSAQPSSSVTVFDGALQLGQVTASGAGAWSLSPALATGSHSLTAKASDGGGTSAASAALSLTVDTTLPGVSITQPAASAALASATAVIKFTVTDNNPDVSTCSVDNQAAVSCSGAGWTTPTLGDGPHNALVTHVDKAGNSASANVNFSTDVTAPAAPSITSPFGTPAYVNSLTPDVKGSAQAGSSVELFESGSSLGSALADNAGNWTIKPTLTGGSHQLTAKATDVGGTSTASAALFLVIDTNQPGVSITQPASSAQLKGPTVDVHFSVIDTNAGSTTCKVDNGSANSCSSPFTTPALADGQHTVTVAATDAADNTASTTISFTIDSAPPAAPQISAPANGTFTAASNVAVSGTAEIASTVKLYDGASLLGNNGAPAGNWNFSAGLASEGVHVLTATATDAVGNVSAASTAKTVTIDRTDPVVTPGALAAVIATKSVAIAFSVTDLNPGATTTCKVDAAAATTCASGFSTPDLSDGDHQVTISHTDKAGNAGTAVLTFSIDVTAPVITVSAPAEGAHTIERSPAVAFSVSELHPGGSPTCAFDGAPAAPCTSPVTPGAPLAVGAHTVTISSADAVGNAASRVVSFVIDPGATEPTGPTDPAGSTGATGPPPITGPTGPVTKPKPKPAKLRVAKSVRNAAKIKFLVRCPNGCKLTGRFLVAGVTSNTTSIKFPASSAWQRVTLVNRRKAYLARQLANGAKVKLTIRVSGLARTVRVTR